MDIGIFVFHDKGCKILKWTAFAGGGIIIPGSAQKCVDMDNGECGDGGAVDMDDWEFGGGSAGLIFGLDDLDGLFEF